MKSKLIVTIIAALIAVTVKSQVFVSFGAGASVSPEVKPVASLEMGVLIRQHLVVGGGFISSPSASIELPNVFYGKLGGIANLSDLVYIGLYTGYSRQVFSTDKPGVNTTHILFSGEIVKRLSYNSMGQLFVSGFTSGKYGAFTVGLRGFLNKGKQYDGCTYSF